MTEKHAPATPAPAPGFRPDDGTGDGAVGRKLGGLSPVPDVNLRSAPDGYFRLGRRREGMFARVRSWLRLAWPFVGSAYLAYLAFQAPPVRYVGVIGLAVVTPLLVGWMVGRLFGVGPWADGSL